MKRLLLVFLCASLVGNAALITATALRARGRHGEATVLSPEPDSPTASRVAVTSSHGRSHSSPAAIASAASSKSTVWSKLDTGDLPKLVANLRASGMPEEMVRTIVESIVSKRFMARRLALEPQTGTQPFWKADAYLGYDPARQAELRALGHEEQQLLKELLGDVPHDERWRNSLANRYGPLPAGKLQMVADIASDYSDLSSQTMSGFRGMLMPWDREQLAFLGSEQRKDLAAVLTPAELETYDLYASNTANSIRSRLTSFGPTEEEFLSLFRLQSVFDAKYTTSLAGFYSSGIPDTSSMQQRSADQEAFNQQIKAALGDQRYAEYQRSQDFGFRSAARIAERLSLPPENAEAVYALQKELQQRAAALRSDRSQPPEQRNAALAAVAAEANERLTSLLTAQGAEAYKSSGGQWLRSLERTAQARQRSP